MEEFYYAQIENGVCIGVSSLAGEVIQDNMIRIESFDLGLIERSFSNGVFGDIVPPPPLTYDEQKQKYVKLISDAQILGDTEEVARLQAEWLTVKASYNV